MLSFDYEGHILPILEFADGSNGRGMKIRTIMPDQNKNKQFLNPKFFDSESKFIFIQLFTIFGHFLD
jgi:hypothetical protein